MATRTTRFAAVLILSFLLPAMPAAADHSDGPTKIGATFPADFPAIKNYYLGVPVIGFGARHRRHSHVPVIFLHGN